MYLVCLVFHIYLVFHMYLGLQVVYGKTNRYLTVWMCPMYCTSSPHER